VRASGVDNLFHGPFNYTVVFQGDAGGGNPLVPGNPIIPAASPEQLFSPEDEPIQSRNPV
jgi:hypothetical protein